MQETAKLLGITQLPTSGGYPQTDGQVERMNRTLKQMLAKIVTRNGKDWDELLGPVLFAYRIAPQASGGEMPFSLVPWMGHGGRKRRRIKKSSITKTVEESGIVTTDNDGTSTPV